MSVQISSLAHNTLPDTSSHTLYTSPANLTSIVKSIRLVNKGTSSVTINLQFTSGSNTCYIAPPNMVIPAGGMVIDDQEITMGPNDAVSASASVGNVIDYVISGIQR